MTLSRVCWHTGLSFAYEQGDFFDPWADIMKCASRMCLKRMWEFQKKGARSWAKARGSESEKEKTIETQETMNDSPIDGFFFRNMGPYAVEICF